MLSLKNIMAILAFAAGTLAAPGAPAPEVPKPTITQVAFSDGLPINLNKTFTLTDGGDHDLDSCEISCHPWYTFCERGSYKYRCNDDGSFKFGRYHPGCHRQCMCSCDSQ